MRDTEAVPLRSIAEVHFSVDLRSDSGPARFDWDDRAFSYALENSTTLQIELDNIVSAMTRGEIRVGHVRVLRGSLEIIAGLFVAYEAISKWKDFSESLQLMAAQMTAAVRTFLSRRLPGEVDIDARVLVRADLARSSRGQRLSADPLQMYLVASNAVMLAVIIGLLIALSLR